MDLNLALSFTRDRDEYDDQNFYEIEEFDPYIEITETPHAYILIAHLPGT